MTGLDASGPPPDRGISGLVGRGLRWSFVNQLVNRIFTFGSSVVVLRILDVEDVGVYGAAMAVVTMLIAINELGQIPGIVRWQGDAVEAGRTAWTIALVSSTGWFLLVLLFAPLVADVVGEPQVTGVLRVLSVTVLVDGVSSIPQALLYREIRQERVMVAEGVGMAVQITVTIGLAVAGAGPYALALGMVTSNLATTLVMILLIPSRPGFGFDRSTARSLLGFGLPIAGSSLLRDGTWNVDNLVVGGVLGPTSLGYYQLAFNVSSLPVNTVGATVQRVSLASFARLVADRDRLSRGLRRAFALLVAAILPLMLMLIVLAEPAVRFVYGEKWVPAVPVLRILALLGGLRVVQRILVDVLVAQGRSRTEFLVYALWLALLAPALIVAAHTGGLRAVAWTHVAVAAAVVLPVTVTAVRRSGVDVRLLLEPLVRPGVAAAAALLVSLGLLAAIPDAADVVELALVGGGATLVYVATLLPRNPLLEWRTVLRPGQPA